MLTMRLVRLPDGAVQGPVTKPVNPAGSSIGRSPECDLVLDDPLRLVSRRHAWLVPSGPSGAMLHCISTSASLMVNGSVVPPGGECAVADGDRIAIGAFELVLESRRPADAALMELARHVSPAATVPVPPPEPPPIPAPPPPPVASPVRAAAAAPAPPASRASRLDQWFDLDTVADPLGPDSPLAATGPEARPVRPPERAAAVPMPAIPRRDVEPPPVPQVQAQPPAAPALADAAALRRAVLRGAGLADDPDLGADLDWAEHVGALLLSLTEGHFDLLRSRAATKQGLRAEGTQIVARENNPLKFAPDATECLRQLLQRTPRPGFLAPLDALHDAQQDLQMHQLAMVAGMRAAVSELVQRLGPAAIEQAAGPPTGLARWLPVLREAALWRRQCEHHAHLQAHLDEVFEAAFGREFLLAYEAQSRRAGQRPGGGRPAGPRPPSA